MAVTVKTKCCGYDVSAYRVAETITFAKPAGGGKNFALVHTNDYPSKDAAATVNANKRADTNGRFNPCDIAIQPEALEIPPEIRTNADGTEAVVRHDPLPAYADSAAATLSTWFTPPADWTAEEKAALATVAAKLSLHDLVWAYAYDVAKRWPTNKGAVDA